MSTPAKRLIRDHAGKLHAREIAQLARVTEHTIRLYASEIGVSLRMSKPPKRRKVKRPESAVNRFLRMPA